MTTPDPIAVAITKTFLATGVVSSDEKLLTFLEALSPKRTDLVITACANVAASLTREVRLGDILREYENLERAERALEPPEAKCPVCGAKCNPDGKCMACPWSPSDATAHVDYHWCCAWNANGKRCHYPGTISKDTLGNGPNYCRHHIQCDDPFVGASHVEDSHRKFPSPDWSPQAARDRYRSKES